MLADPPFMALALGAVLAGLGQILFKAGAIGSVSVLDFLNLWVALGLASYALGTLLWIFALSKADLMVAYPFTTLTFALVYLGAYVVFDERITVGGAIGVLLILAGVFLIVRSVAASGS